MKFWCTLFFIQIKINFDNPFDTSRLSMYVCASFIYICVWKMVWHTLFACNGCVQHWMKSDIHKKYSVFWMINWINWKILYFNENKNKINYSKNLNASLEHKMAQYVQCDNSGTSVEISNKWITSTNMFHTPTHVHAYIESGLSCCGSRWAQSSTHLNVNIEKCISVESIVCEWVVNTTTATTTTT